MSIYEDTFISGNPVRINLIASLIAEAVNQYVLKTGYDPDSVYLGSVQYKALKEYLRDQVHYYVSDLNSCMGQFHGLNVYRVLVKDHLAVSGMR